MLEAIYHVNSQINIILKKSVEGIFIEINLRKVKFLLFATYHSTHAVYGMSNEDYLEEVGLALDVYSNYDKFILAGDFNMEVDLTYFSEFLNQYQAKNLVKEKTCFKSMYLKPVSWYALKAYLKDLKIN